MMPNDFFKLIYQNSHGPHHLNSTNIVNNFQKEITSISLTPKYKYEFIGNDYYRIYLNPTWNDDTKNQVLNAFIKSNLDYQPNINLFEYELSLLNELIKNNIISIDFKLFTNCLNTYKDNNYGPISHSLEYKNHYDPHYVLIHKTFLNDILDIL